MYVKCMPVTLKFVVHRLWSSRIRITDGLSNIIDRQVTYKQTEYNKVK